MTLTGKVRYRSRRSGFCLSREELVLQVEYTYMHTSCCGGFIECETASAWRDAKTEDLAVLYRQEYLRPQP